MNTMTKVITAMTFSVATIGAANAAQYIATDSYVGTELCVKAAKGNEFRMGKAIKANNLTKQYVIENVQCNNMNILSFVEEHGRNADGMQEFLTEGTYQGKVKITDIAAL